jgi:hypothetical protein
VEGVVALGELGWVLASIAVAAGLDRRLDDPQLGWAGALGGEHARLGFLNAPELEQHEDVIEVGRDEDADGPAARFQPDPADAAVGRPRQEAVLRHAVRRLTPAASPTAG